MTEKQSEEVNQLLDMAGGVRLVSSEWKAMEADIALATDTITKCNAWIAEAKPLLDRGGNAERALASLVAAVEMCDWSYGKVQAPEVHEALDRALEEAHKLLPTQ